MSQHFFGFDCAWCGAAPNYACADCEQVGYCSQECADRHGAEEHWGHHKDALTQEEIEKNYELQAIDDDGAHIWTVKPELVEGRRAKKWMQGAVEHPGSFRRAAKKRKMSVDKFARHVMADKHHRYNTRLHRQANLYMRFKQSRH